MGLFSVFERNEHNKKKSHLKNLVEMALADGNIDAIELKLLKDICTKLEMSESDIEEIRKHPESIKFTPPSSEKAKIRQINELVKMMIADKKIEENEVKLCKSLAVKLNLIPNIVDDLIELHVGGVKPK